MRAPVDLGRAPQAHQLLDRTLLHVALRGGVRRVARLRGWGYVDSAPEIGFNSACLCLTCGPDHLTGLLQLLQLNAPRGVTVYYPADSGSFPALAEFQRQFDPHVEAVQWVGVRPGDHVVIGKNMSVRVESNQHVPAPSGQCKSVGYTILETRRKLKPEYVGLSGTEIRDLGPEATVPIEIIKIAYSGDSPVDDMTRYEGAEVLIHEATFLSADQLDEHGQRNRHSSLDLLMPLASQLSLGALVLSHFSARSDAEQIDAAIVEWCEKCQPRFPVFRVLPGLAHFDLLNGSPLWAPRP